MDCGMADPVQSHSVPAVTAARHEMVPVDAVPASLRPHNGQSPKSVIGLRQPRATEPFKIMGPVRFQLDRPFRPDPIERDVRLHAAALRQSGSGEACVARHARAGSKHPMGFDKIAALAYRVVR